MRALATLRGPGSFVRSYGRESENAREHLLTLLQLRPTLTLRALVLASQVRFAHPIEIVYVPRFPTFRQLLAMVILRQSKDVVVLSYVFTTPLRGVYSCLSRLI